MLVEKQVPKNKWDKIYKYSQIDFSGESFMLHPDILLHHSHKYTYREVAQYIALCSLRSHAEYEATKQVTLDAILVPGIGPDPFLVLETNRLLTLDEDEQVHFLYEEVKPEEIH
tara:strand:+ start:401 stop:742 length:342 start_codon:yes stop_codon:yes gene_type:complete